MATKDDLFLPHDGRVNFSSNANQNDQYNNLNLNANQTCAILETVQSKSNSTNSNRNNNYASTKVSESIETGINVNHNKLSSSSWKNNGGGGIWSTGSNMLDTFGRNQTSKNDKTSTTKATSNSSTLSLHIAAYENSTEAPVGLNSAENDEIGSKQKRFNKTSKNVKTFSPSASLGCFEIPRQQSEGAPTSEPEIMQFKSSQKLLNPNMPPLSETILDTTVFSSMDHKLKAFVKVFVDRKLFNNSKLGLDDNVCVEEMKAIVLEKLQLSIEDFDVVTMSLLDKKSNEYLSVGGNYVIKPFDKFEMFLASKEQKMEIIISYSETETKKLTIDTSKTESIKDLSNILSTELDVKEGKIEIKKFDEDFDESFNVEDDEKLDPTKRYNIKIEKIVKFGANVIPGGHDMQKETRNQKVETQSSMKPQAHDSTAEIQEGQLSLPPPLDGEKIRDIATNRHPSLPAIEESEVPEVVPATKESINESQENAGDKVENEKYGVSNVSQTDEKVSKSGADEVVQSYENGCVELAERIEAAKIDANDMPLATTTGAAVDLQHQQSPQIISSKSEIKAKIEKTETDIGQLFEKLSVSNFHDLSPEIIKSCNWNEHDALSTMVDLIFQKAINEPNLAEICAELCMEIHKTEEAFEGDIFQSLFYDEIVRRRQSYFDDITSAECQKQIADKQQNLDILRFISHLYGIGLHSYKIIEDCVVGLLENVQRNEFMIEYAVAFMKEVEPFIVQKNEDATKLHNYIDQANVAKVVVENLKAGFGELLDHLTSSNYREVSAELIKEFNWNDLDRLSILVDLIFEKAAYEHDRSGAFAELCRKLHKEEKHDEKENFQRHFHGAVTRKCQSCFEGPALSEYHGSVSKLEEQLNEAKDEQKIADLNGQLEEIKAKEKKQMLGTSKLISSLYQIKFLNYKIIESCITTLLQNTDLNNVELMVEYAVIFMKEIGPLILQKHGDTNNLDGYVSSIERLKEAVSLRVKAMIIDLMVLRDKKWSLEPENHGTIMAPSNAPFTAPTPALEAQQQQPLFTVANKSVNEEVQLPKIVSSESAAEAKVEKIKTAIDQLLDTLILETFDEACAEIQKICGDWTDAASVNTIVEIIFQKAIKKPYRSEILADLCLKLNDSAEAAAKDGKNSFHTGIMEKCIKVFNQDLMDYQAAIIDIEVRKSEYIGRRFTLAGIDKEFDAINDEQKRRMTGISKLMSRLYKNGLLHIIMIKDCIEILFSAAQKSKIKLMIEFGADLMKKVQPFVDGKEDDATELHACYSNLVELQSKLPFDIENLVNELDKLFGKKKVEIPPARVKRQSVSDDGWESGVEREQHTPVKGGTGGTFDDGDVSSPTNTIAHSTPVHGNFMPPQNFAWPSESRSGANNLQQREEYLPAVQSGEKRFVSNYNENSSARNRDFRSGEGGMRGGITAFNAMIGGRGRGGNHSTSADPARQLSTRGGRGGSYSSTPAVQSDFSSRGGGRGGFTSNAPSHMGGPHAAPSPQFTTPNGRGRGGNGSSFVAPPSHFTTPRGRGGSYSSTPAVQPSFGSRGGRGAFASNGNSNTSSTPVIPPSIGSTTGRGGNAFSTRGNNNGPMSPHFSTPVGRGGRGGNGFNSFVAPPSYAPPPPSAERVKENISYALHPEAVRVQPSESVEHHTAPFSRPASESAEKEYPVRQNVAQLYSESPKEDVPVQQPTATPADVDLNESSSTIATRGGNNSTLSFTPSSNGSGPAKEQPKVYQARAPAVQPRAPEAHNISVRSNANASRLSIPQIEANGVPLGALKSSATSSRYPRQAIPHGNVSYAPAPVVPASATPKSSAYTNAFKSGFKTRMESFVNGTTNRNATAESFTEFLAQFNDPTKCIEDIFSFCCEDLKRSEEKERKAASFMLLKSLHNSDYKNAFPVAFKNYCKKIMNEKRENSETALNLSFSAFTGRLLADASKIVGAKDCVEGFKEFHQTGNSIFAGTLAEYGRICPSQGHASVGASMAALFKDFARADPFYKSVQFQQTLSNTEFKYDKFNNLKNILVHLKCF